MVRAIVAQLKFKAILKQSKNFPQKFIVESFPSKTFSIKRTPA